MDKLEEIIEKLRKKVDIYFGKDASGHNIDHLERTLRYALYLQSKEGGDRAVLERAGKCAGVEGGRDRQGTEQF